MKQIYNFDREQPPVVTESMLRDLEESRRVRRQALLVGAAGVLMQIALVITALLMWEIAPWLSLGCIVYVLMSLLGGGTIALIYRRKGGELKWQTAS